MIVSIYKYILYKLQRLVAGQYLDDLSRQVSYQAHKAKHAEDRATQYAEKLDKANEHRVVMERHLNEVLSRAPVQEKVWVLDTKMYAEFCKEFEPPIINHQNTPTDAAFRLGIQRVLSRIGEKHVGR